MRKSKGIVAWGARFCGPGCRDSYRLNRQLGLIYPPCRGDDGRIYSWSEASYKFNFCAYCGADLGVLPMRKELVELAQELNA